MPIYKKENTSSKKLKAIAVPAVAMPSAVPKTPFHKFIKRVRGLFTFLKTKKEINLTGRIHELDADAEVLMISLQRIKSYFDPAGQYAIGEDDPELGIFLEAIIDPLLKEADMLRQTLHSSSVAGQAKIFKRFNLWIDRSEHWVDYFEKKRTKKELVDAVVHYLVGEALQRIDRDVEVIREYINHQVQSLPVDDERKRYLKQRIDSSVEVHIENLNLLKKRPSKITFEGIGYWKSQIDQCRQTYFDMTLHAVDVQIEEEFPEASNKEYSDHLQDSLLETVILESEVQEIADEVAESDLKQLTIVKRLLSHINALEDEAHTMLLDLRLDGDVISRAEDVLERLKEIKKQIR
ncbi:MAG: hypothetical protein WC222_02330 [Parachlamydiales bacterium]|jgi:hypothetical protein